MSKPRVLIFGDRSWLSPDVEQHLLQAGYSLITLCTKAFETLADESSIIRPDVIVYQPASSEEEKVGEVVSRIGTQQNIPIVNIGMLAGKAVTDQVEEQSPGTYPLSVSNVQMLSRTLERSLSERFGSGPQKEPVELKLMTNRKRSPGFICVRSDHRLTCVRFDEILYVEAMKDYVLIYTENMIHTSHISLKEVQTLLPDQDFVRIHRSFIVRLDKITTIKYPEMIVGGKIRTLPIGGCFRRNLYERLLII